MTPRLPILLAVLLAAQPVADSVADDTSGTHVIFISSDGNRPDAITALGPEKAPHFYRLRASGAFTDNARTDFTYSITLPNHTSMITSRGVVGKTGHEWIINDDPKLGQNLHRNKKDYVAGMFDVAHDNGLSTALYASKTKFSLYRDSYGERWGADDTTGEDNGKNKIDTFLIDENTDTLVDALLAQLAESPARLTMVHLRDPDVAGHAEGWNLDGDTPYLSAVQHIDTLLGRILDAVETNQTLKGNTWIILTADHGGWTGTKGHGESHERDNYSIPFYTWGPGVAAAGDLYALNPANRKNPGEGRPDYDEAVQPIRNADAGNLILSLLGLPPIPSSTVNARQDLSVRSAPPSETGTAE
jgi:predicted AlkP superfamily pyrophosphatase or phosphodiesterase